MKPSDKMAGLLSAYHAQWLPITRREVRLQLRCPCLSLCSHSSHPTPDPQRTQHTSFSPALLNCLRLGDEAPFLPVFCPHHSLCPGSPSALPLLHLGHLGPCLLGEPGRGTAHSDH